MNNLRIEGKWKRNILSIGYLVKGTVINKRDKIIMFTLKCRTQMYAFICCCAFMSGCPKPLRVLSSSSQFEVNLTFLTSNPSQSLVSALPRKNWASVEWVQPTQAPISASQLLVFVRETQIFSHYPLFIIFSCFFKFLYLQKKLWVRERE